MAAQVIGDFEQQPGCRGTVICADEGRIAERIVRLVVRGQHDDPVLLAGKTDDEVGHLLWARGRGGDEGVGLQIVVRELLLQIILRAQQSGAAVEAWSAGHKLPRIFERLGAAELCGGLRMQQRKRDQQQAAKDRIGESGCGLLLLAIAPRRMDQIGYAIPTM